MATIERTPPTHQAIGRVIESESREGLPGLVVTLYHVTDPKQVLEIHGAERLAATATRLGSVLTDQEGGFRIDYGLPAQTTAPNLAMVVAGPEEDTRDGNQVLHVSRSARRDAGLLESFSIAVARRRLEALGIAVVPTTEARAGLYKADFAAEEALSTEIVAFHADRVAAETVDREAIRKELLRQVATDVSVAVFPGEVVTGEETEDNENEIDQKVDIVAAGSVSRGNTTIGGGRGVPVTIYLTPEDRTRLESFLQDATDGFAVIPESELQDVLFRTGSSANPGTLLIHQNPVARYCSEKTFEETCAAGHVEIPLGHGPSGHGPNKGQDGEDGETSGGARTDVTEALSNENVPVYAAHFLEGAPSPDNVLSGTTSGQRPDKSGLEAAVDAFSLRAGPADVPAYYDFQNLQIAFDHVWKILIDEEMVDAAHSLDKAFTKKTGVSLRERFTSNWTDVTATDRVLYEGTPREVPAVVLAHFDITLPEWTDLNASYQAKLREIATELDAACTGPTKVQIGILSYTTGSRCGTLSYEKRRQDLRERGERIIDSVRHDDYYTLHRTLQDLRRRIDAGYEFTVFAADRSTMAVNFGLLTTFRQEWVPISYQAGRLVKTIALTPKEERRWSMPEKRELQAARKEAEKNNSTLSAEQSSSSRVESEIMAKAQTKTDFNLSANGTYNTWLSKGTQTTTFGVEAAQESSSARKDFREAVLKAAQEYKDERSVEITTEETDSSEYTESGVIVNPNDELSVTYLFYELQRRYRVSEQLHRVQPVVMVAQEVPAPHQITEAWVIAHDWIINRALLDDSFRPALTYLGTKSVGEDFALRELRKNLRQQRNIVETLRLEYAMATQEAESRYAALEAAIGRRIGEEEAEDTDSWFSDIGEFFGGGGQSPEAAKARELAAKDAHQFAVERAEKQGAALNQEIRTLSAVTREYNDTLRKHLDNETRVHRLLVHIRQNIFHYMQAIWSMEPPDQRFLRLHKVKVPTVELDTVPDPQDPAIQVPDRTYLVEVQPSDDVFEQFRPAGTTRHRAFLRGRMKKGSVPRPLAEVADLGTPLGFKGNYMIFPMKEHNALTEFMAAPYVDAAFGAMDPDELGNISLHDYSRYVCCLHDQLPENEFEALKPVLKKWLSQLLSDPLRNGEEIVVPTGSVFVEALPGAHPLLEDFKLRHRALDVYKAQNEVRHGGLEALRLAARLVNSEREDPDVDRRIVVDGALTPSLGVHDD